MIGFDPSLYVVVASYHGSVNVICTTCRDGTHWDRSIIGTWDAYAEGTIADQNTSAQDHHQRYHADTDTVIAETS